MHTIRILLVPTGKHISLKLEMDTLVYDICRDLYTKIVKHISGPVEDFGLFVPDQDPTRAYWLDNSKPVCYYPLADKNLVLEFKSRIRRLIVRTMDDTKKTLAIDDSKTIAELILPICNKMGISNHEEYSLIREIDEEEKMKTMTLKKGKTQIRDFEKMEKMKQKLKTDDELNWLPHAKTLRQLGIDEKDELLLRRKYFFSDQNVDARDPIQLNLLYVQLRDAIIDGTHPVSIEEAIQLAGIQCQAEMNNATPDKQKLLHSRLKEYLPKEYLKTKVIEKRIWQHYEKMNGVSDKDAKVQYAQLCRSLKTYGITFFLVKEKVRAKNKLVPRLLGISKENVMRVDEKTKEIIYTWPLTTVRRYAATASLFSLDFGDYSDENYVIQTLEGEKIAQIIAGYIDIILKKQKAKDQFDVDVDEETAMIEENVAPSKANVISHNEVDAHRRGIQQHSIASIGQVGAAGGVRNGGVGRLGQISQGHVGLPQAQTLKNEGKIGLGRVNAPTQKFQIRDLSQPKRALMVRIGENLKILQAATEDLDKHLEVAKLGNDESARTYRKTTLDVTKNRIKGNLMSMTMATGNLLSMIQYENESDEGEDYGRIDTAITTIGYNTERLLDNVRKVYEVTHDWSDDDGIGSDLVGAAKSLLSAFQDLLNASKPYKTESDKNLAEEMEDENYKPFSDKGLLEAVNRVGEASRAMLQLITVEKNISEDEWEKRDVLLTDAKQIASMVSNLVKLVKDASVPVRELHGSESQINLIQSAKQLGQATSMLVSAAKVVACSAEQPLSQQQLYAASRHVTASVDDVIQIVQPLQETHKTIYVEMESYGTEICRGIDRMQHHVVGNTISAHQDEMVTKFLAASERMPTVMGNRAEMMEQAKILVETGSQLVTCLGQSSSNIHNQSDYSKKASNASLDSNDNKQRRLMIASQALADAVEKLVQATKVCHLQSPQASPIEVEESQQVLANAANHMISVAHMTAGEIIRQRITKGLEFAGRHTAMTADQLVISTQEAAKAALQAASTQHQHHQLATEAQQMTDVVLPAVVSACSRIRRDPSDSQAQNHLLDTCQTLIKSLDQLLKHSEALSPQVQDPSFQNALNLSVQTSGSTLADLKETVDRAEHILRPTRAASIAHLEEEGQLQLLHSLLDTAAEAVARGELYPLPGETIESISSIIGNCSRTANKTLDKLYEDLAALQMKLESDGNLEGSDIQLDLMSGARNLMESMEKLLKGARGIAAFSSRIDSNDNLYEKQIELIDCGQQIIRSGEDVIQTLKLGSVGASNLDDVKRSIDQMQMDIDILVKKLPASKKIDDLVSRLNETMLQFDQDCVKKMSRRQSSASSTISSKSHNQLQSEFTAAVAIFNQTLNELVNSPGNYSSLNTLTSQLQESHSMMLFAGSALLAAQSPADDVVMKADNQLSKGLHIVSDETSQLLDQLKDVLANSGGPDVNLMKQSLLKAAGAVSESINDLLSSCATSLPRSQQICESSQRQVETLKTSLLSEPPSLPLNSDSYSDCIDNVDKNAEILLSEIRRIPTTCKSNNVDEFTDSIQRLATATTSMLTAATQANYRIGVIQSSNWVVDVSNLSDNSETSGFRDEIESHSRQIKLNCSDLTSDEISELKCRELANDIKKRAGNVCQLLKEVIQRTSDKNKQARLLEAGKIVAENTSNLIRTISANPRSLARDSWTEASNKVAECVDNLISIMDSSIDSIENDKSEKSNEITEEGKLAQQHIHKVSLDLIDGSTSLLRAASALSKDPTSIPANQAYIINQRTCDEAIKKLRDTVKYCSPGQQEFLETQEDVKHLLRSLARVSTSMEHNKTVWNSAAVSADLQRLKSSLKQFQCNVASIDGLLRSRTKLEYLGKAAAQAGSYLAPLTESVLNLSVSLSHSRERAEIVELTRTVLEAFLLSVEDCQVIKDPQDTKGVLEAVGSLKEGISDLMNFNDGIISAQDTVEGYISSLQKSMNKLSTGEGVDYSYMVSTQANGGDVAAIGHTKIIQCVRSMTSVLVELSLGDIESTTSTTGGGLKKKESLLMKKARNQDSSVTPASANTTTQGGITTEKRLIQDYDGLVMGILQVVYGRAHKDNGDQLKKIGISIGQTATDMIRYEQTDLTNQIRYRLNDLTLALQSSAKATQAYISAVGEIGELTNDLDTAILFASSGTLNLSTIDLNDSNDVSPISLAQMKDEVAKSFRLLKGDLQKILSESQINEPSSNKANVNQDKLVNAIVTCVTHLRDLCLKSRLGAISLQDSTTDIDGGDGYHSQTMMLNAVRDVNVAVVDFLTCLKNRAGSSADQQSHILVSKDAALNKMEGLVKTITSLEDKEQKGVRALETALEAMQKELKVLEAWSPEQDFGSLISDSDGVNTISYNEEHDMTCDDESLYTAENLMLMTKPLVTASQKAMEAVQTFRQEDILVAANFGRKAIQDFARHLRKTVTIQLKQESNQKERRGRLLFTGPGGNELDQQQSTQKMIENSKGAVKALIDVYEQLGKAVNETKLTRVGSKQLGGGASAGAGASTYKMQATLASRRVAHAIHEVGESAKTLIIQDTNQNSETDGKTTEETPEKAKEELEDAARQVEAVAQKLALLKKPKKSDSSPRSNNLSPTDQPVVQEELIEEVEDEDDDELLRDCRSVVSSTQELLIAAGHAQKEFEGAHGFVGAARMVAAATEALCSAARTTVMSNNPTSQQQSSVVSAARQVAAGTARLLLAGQVKAAGNQSKASNELQAAGARVRRSTDVLVKKAAQGASEWSKEPQEPLPGGPSTSIVTSMRTVIQAQAELVAKERELEMLRSKYNTIRQEHITTHPEYFEDN